jgi:hypothetical protein
MKKLDQKTPKCCKECENSHPIWWHSFATLMKLTHRTKTKLLLEGDEAKLMIARRHRKGQIQYDVMYQLGKKQKHIGNISLDHDQMLSAFGFKSLSDEESASLIKRYGGEAVVQGKFIRWKEFLNIPCVGTGFHGDPNISILITPELTKAIADNWIKNKP